MSKCGNSIHLKKLLFLKTLDLERDKNRRDVGLIVKKLIDEQYADWWADLLEERRQYYLAQKKQT